MWTFVAAEKAQKSVEGRCCSAFFWGGEGRGSETKSRRTKKEQQIVFFPRTSKSPSEVIKSPSEGEKKLFISFGDVAGGSRGESWSRERVDICSGRK